MNETSFLLNADKEKGNIFNHVSPRLIAALQVFLLLYFKYMQLNPKKLETISSSEGRISETGDKFDESRTNLSQAYIPLVNAITKVEEENRKVHLETFQTIEGK
jgi:hypothetical protein